MGMEETMNSRSSSSSSSSFSKPSWLLSTIADLDQKMKMLTLNNNNTTAREEHDTKPGGGDSFAERAEAYYLKRPQLLDLVEDLYNGYLSLADRYSQTLAKHRRHSFPFEEPQEDCYNDDNDQPVDSDVESSLSYQLPPPLTRTPANIEDADVDIVVAQLVMKMVDYDIVANELDVVEGQLSEWSRKMELQKSLLEVLESERVILLNENAKLGYGVKALIEENKCLAAESLFVKRKAGELARRCVTKMREDEDQRAMVLVLSRKIEDLQEQMYNMVRKNKLEYYQQQQQLIWKRENLHMIQQQQVVIEADKNRKKTNKGCSKKKKVSKWWDRVKNSDFFLCGPHSNF